MRFTALGWRLSFSKARALGDKTVRSLLEGEKYLAIVGYPFITDPELLRRAFFFEGIPSWWPERGLVIGEEERKRVLKEQLQQLLALCRDKGLAPTDVVVYTLSPGALGYHPDENFYSYLAGVEFARKGYLVMKTNLTGIGAGDDFFAFKPQDLEKGAFFLELTLGLVEVSPTKSTEGEAVFMEIEDTPREISQNHGLPKAQSQLDSFTQSYIVAPFIEHYATTEKCPHCGSPLPEGAASCPSCLEELGWGVVTWDREGNLILKPSKGKGKETEKMLAEVNFWVERAVSHGRLARMGLSG
jgi:hypothetical protein